MNPVTQAVGALLHPVVDALKAHPTILAMAVMNFGLMGIVWYELQQIFAQQGEIHALLSKCVDPEILKMLGLLPRS